jgi:SAM-dependent methyltransferase
MRILEINGSDVDHFECPRCGANDRLRHLMLYMRATHIDERMRAARILHFAPEKKLVEYILAVGAADYVRADIAPSSSEIVRVDMTSMSFADDRFDIVIANHVLEHVDDLPAALSEVARVLAPGGLAILQTPYSLVLSAMFEDPAITSEAARLELYGQEDHVRLFGRDIVAHLVSLSGLESCVRTHEEALPGIEFRRYGVNPHEPFLLFRKPGQRKSGSP